MTSKGSLLIRTGKYADSIVVFSSGIAALRSTGTTQWTPSFLPSLASAYAELGQFAEASRCSTEALDTIARTKETRWEAEANRIAGEITLKLPMQDAKGAVLFSASAFSCTPAASEVLGIARRNEHGAALARPGQAG